MLRRVQQLAMALTLPCWVWIGLSYLGGLHPAADSLSVLRFEVSLVALALSVVLLATRALWRGALGALAALVIAVPIILDMRIAPAGPARADAISLYQKNVWLENPSPEELVADLRRVGADIITLQEVTDPLARVINTLAGDYPHQHRCWGGVYILTRLALAEGGARCPQDRRLNVIALQVETGAGPLWVVALHLRWPWPYGQVAQVDRILPFLAELDGPVVVAGDFNMVPWGHSVQQISAAAGAERVGRLERTFDFGSPLVRLRIDHVLAPRGWQGSTALRPLAGSDHFGVVARFGPP